MEFTLLGLLLRCIFVALITHIHFHICLLCIQVHFHSKRSHSLGKQFHSGYILYILDIQSHMVQWIHSRINLQIHYLGNWSHQCTTVYCIKC